jgi:hypothetical protein
LQLHEPNLYARTSYTIVEISEQLAKRQREKLLHHKNAFVRNMSIFDWKQTIHGECFVIALEVIDNFPHDKIVTIGGALHQTHVCQSANKRNYESYMPVSDSLICEYLSIAEKIRTPLEAGIMKLKNLLLKGVAKTQPLNHVFIPTMAFSFIKLLERYVPHHRLILADFDFLPDTMPGKNAPLVQGKEQANSSNVFQTYCSVEKGSCDIFFPTDFNTMKDLYCYTTNRPARSVHVIKHAQFLRQYADYKKTSTQTGYNPLLEDYINMSFILS